MPRDNFTESERKQILKINAEMVKSRWPECFENSAPHYICESCGFVSDRSGVFEIDHVWPCDLGGTSNRWVSSRRLYEEIIAGDARAIYEHGVNAQVLCRGCNRSKGTKQFAPRTQKAYAIQYAESDRNPDHMYSGPPAVRDL
jgi:5-methylcytosine-specific restriction endonuclease McrA